jgi:hypothetical protein
MSNINSNNFVAGLQDAVRQNPVSAALVGMGVLWMFTGGARITAAAALLAPAARAAATGVGTGSQMAVDAVGAASESVRSFGSRVADSVRDTVSDASASVNETASQAYDAVKGAAAVSVSKTKTAAGEAASTRGVATSLQGNLRNTLERQPLLLGAIGLALGAGMAATLPRTDMESEFAGDAADRVTKQLKDFTSEQVDRATETAKRTVEVVKEEAAAQGLTPQGAKDGAAAVVEKLKKVAQAPQRKSS